MNHIIVTHAGSFHADEIMAVALLERFYLIRPLAMSVDLPAEVVQPWFEGQAVQRQHLQPRFWDGVEDCRTPVPVVRTRDAGLLKKACAHKDTFVVDVGGEFDPLRLNFDHHQKSMTHTWEDGTPLSSTGLVWRWLKQQGHLAALDPLIVEDLEKLLIKPLDQHDNGVASCTLAVQCATYNRSTEDPQEQDRQFFKALDMMREALENQLFACQLKLEATQVLTKQWQKAQQHHDTVVSLRYPIAYHDCTGLLKQISKGQADMIVIPGQGNRFSVISMGMDTPFSIKVPCPAHWRGRMNFQEHIQGKDVLIKFAHKSGFMCVVEGNHKDALAVGRHIVQQHHKHLAKTRAGVNASEGAKGNFKRPVR